ncbi:hypothetical protein BC940DRAFT_370338 [Gongronella butleri]|nr:hypothetical protein BC940DRAFT_370338 [Gongronella butleri]
MGDAHHVSGNTTSPMEALPDELLSQIFNQVPRAQLARMRVCSRTLCDRISPFVFHTIHLRTQVLNADDGYFGGGDGRQHDGHQAASLNVLDMDDWDPGNLDDFDGSSDDDTDMPDWCSMPVSEARLVARTIKRFKAVWDPNNKMRGFASGHMRPASLVRTIEVCSPYFHLDDILAMLHVCSNATGLILGPWLWDFANWRLPDDDSHSDDRHYVLHHRFIRTACELLKDSKEELADHLGNKLNAMLALLAETRGLERLDCSTLTLSAFRMYVLPHLAVQLRHLDLRIDRKMLKKLQIEDLPAVFSWQELVDEIQQACPRLVFLGVTMPAFTPTPHGFIHEQHRARDDHPNCDACSNPWLSIRTLCIDIDMASGYDLHHKGRRFRRGDYVDYKQAHIAYICLKFPKLERFALVANETLYNYSYMNALQDEDAWQALLDPSVAYLPHLASFECSEYGTMHLDALSLYTSAGHQPSRLKELHLSSILVGDRDDYVNTFGILKKFPHLLHLHLAARLRVTKSDSYDMPEYFDEPEALGLGCHDLQSLHLSMSPNPTFLIRLSQVCHALTTITFGDKRHDRRVKVPREIMPHDTMALDIVQKLTKLEISKERQYYSRFSVHWHPLPHATQLSTLRLDTDHRVHTILFIQTPACHCSSQPPGLLNGMSQSPGLHNAISQSPGQRHDALVYHGWKVKTDDLRAWKRRRPAKSGPGQPLCRDTISHVLNEHATLNPNALYTSKDYFADLAHRVAMEYGIIVLLAPNRPANLIINGYPASFIQ